jgi:hypothetical protein
MADSFCITEPIGNNGNGWSGIGIPTGCFFLFAAKPIKKSDTHPKKKRFHSGMRVFIIIEFPKCPDETNRG